MSIQQRPKAGGTHHSACETSSSVPVRARRLQGAGIPEENRPFVALAKASDADPIKIFCLL